MKSGVEKVFEKENLDEIAFEVISFLKDRRIMCFKGELGTGKTALISAICRVLGSSDLINSPTFSMVNSYNSSNGIIFHFDLYRMNTLEEIMDIGFEEYIYSGNYCFIEWPELVLDILPKSLIVNCQLSYLSLNSRKIKVWAD